MYIRRKVFSVIKDENGEEKYFSTTEFLNEETYLEQKEYGVVDKIATRARGIANKAIERAKPTVEGYVRVAENKGLGTAGAIAGKNLAKGVMAPKKVIELAEKKGVSPEKLQLMKSWRLGVGEGGKAVGELYGTTAEAGARYAKRVSEMPELIEKRVRKIVR